MYKYTIVTPFSHHNEHISNSGKSLGSVECRTHQEFIDLIRKDAESNIIQVIELKGFKKRIESSKGQQKELLTRIVEEGWDGQNKGLTLYNGELVERNYIGEHSYITPPSESEIQKTLQSVARKYADNYFGTETIQEKIFLGESGELKPFLHYELMVPLFNRTGFVVKRSYMAQNGGYYMDRAPTNLITSDFTPTDPIEKLRNDIIADHTMRATLPLRGSGFLSDDDYMQIGHIVNEQHGRQGFSEPETVKKVTYDYIRQHHQDRILLTQHRKFIADVVKRPGLIFSLPWIKTDSPYVERLTGYIEELMRDNEFIMTAFKPLEKEIADYIFESWWKHVRFSIFSQELQKGLPWVNLDADDVQEVIDQSVADFVNGSISFRTLIENLSTVKPELSDFYETVRASKPEQMQPDEDLVRITRSATEAFILSTPHSKEWFNRHLDPDVLYDNGYTLTIDNSFTELFYYAESDESKDLFISHFEHAGINDWVAHHVWDIYPSLNLVVTLSDNTTQEFKNCLEQSATEVLGTRAAVTKISRAAVSSLLSDDDYINAYQKLIAQELNKRNIDEYNVTIVWDLDN